MSFFVYILIAGALPIHLFLRRYGTGLRKIPGPIVACFTDLWRFWMVWYDSMPEESLRLHRRYGPLVRIGPSYVSASSEDSVHAIYRAGTGFAKSDVYNMLQPQLGGTDLHNLFSTQDKAFHATLKRHLGGLYSQRGIATSEPNIDRTIQLFVDRLKHLAGVEPTRIDMASWMQYWAFDTIGEINFSHQLGFLSHGKDIDNLCNMSHQNMKYFGLMGQVLTLERLWTSLTTFCGTRKSNPLFKFVLDCAEERLALPKQSQDKLDSFLELHRDKPGHFSFRDVISASYITLVTAHDVLAISLRAILYYVAKNPVVFKNIKGEIAEADRAGKLSTPVQYAEATEMKYINAVITETLRIHPSTGLIFERLAPEGGVELHGKYIPAGTTIGVNAWVFNRDKDIFGKDSEEFRPERWIEDTEDNLKTMTKWLFTFSAGARSCIGRNLAMMEMTKLMVELYRRFDFQLAEPNREWHVDGNWLTAQKDMDMIVTVTDPFVSLPQ